MSRSPPEKDMPSIARPSFTGKVPCFISICDDVGFKPETEFSTYLDFYFSSFAPRISPGNKQTPVREVMGRKKRMGPSH